MHQHVRLSLGAACALACLLGLSACPSVGGDDGTDPAFDLPPGGAVSNDNGTCATGEACACDGEDCERTCEGVGCAFRCAGDAQCDFVCLEGGCDVRCEDASLCELDCPAGGCSVTCEDGAVCRTRSCDELPCDLECRDSATCEMSCEAGSCIGNCADSSRCVMDECGSGCALTCAAGAACALECDQPEGCFVTDDV